MYNIKYLNGIIHSDGKIKKIVNINWNFFSIFPNINKCMCACGYEYIGWVQDMTK